MVEFTVATPPVAISPLNATFERRPTFSWSPVTGAIRYEVQVRNHWTGTKVSSQTTITETSWTPPADLTDGPSRWWVIAIGANDIRSLWSAPTDIHIGGQSTLLTPIGSTTDNLPMFSWSPVDGAVRYELWVTNVGLNARLIHETILTSLSFTPIVPLPKGTYRAWVRAVSSSGEDGRWSTQVNFVIAAVDSINSDLSPGSVLLTSLQSLDSIQAESGEAIGSYPFAARSAAMDSEQDSGSETQAQSGLEWAAPAPRLHLPHDGRRQVHSTMLQNNALPTVETMDGSLLDALMTQFTEVDFTVGVYRKWPSRSDEQYQI